MLLGCPRQNINHSSEKLMAILQNVLHRTLLLMAIIRLALGSSRHPPTPPPYINVGAKKGLISIHGAQN